MMNYRRPHHHIRNKNYIKFFEYNKVYICNFPPLTRDTELRNILSPFADIIDISLIGKRNTNGQLYGFVSVKTEADANKLLLQNGNLTIGGLALVIQRALRQFFSANHRLFTKQPSITREFDLTLREPTKPSIHNLVDDVLVKIFGYLPLRDRIRIEQVCRRWQALIFQLFGAIQKLTIVLESSDIYSVLDCNVNEAGVGKVLSLCGESLQSVEVHSKLLDNVEVLRLLVKFCTRLISLSVSGTFIPDIFFKNLSTLWKDITTVDLRQCRGITSEDMQLIFDSCMYLENFCLFGPVIKENLIISFPSSLKRLAMNAKSMTSFDVMKIPESCPALEGYTCISKQLPADFLRSLAEKCKNMSHLTLYWCSDWNVEKLNPLSGFGNLKKLKVFGGIVNLNLLLKLLPQLEDLDLKLTKLPDAQVDFSSATLRYLRIEIRDPYMNMNNDFCPMFLDSLSSCGCLQSLTLIKFVMEESDFIRIIKNCPSLTYFGCPEMDYTSAFNEMLYDVTKDRRNRCTVALEGITDFGGPWKLNDKLSIIEYGSHHPQVSPFNLLFGNFEDDLLEPVNIQGPALYDFYDDYDDYDIVDDDDDEDDDDFLGLEDEDILVHELHQFNLFDAFEDYEDFGVHYDWINF